MESSLSLKRLFRQSSIYFGGDIIRRGIGFLMIPLYTRYLTPADYGIIELIELFVVVAGICLGLSVVGDSMVRIYHEYSDSDDRGTVISSAIITVAVLGLAIVATVMLVGERISMLVFRTPEYAALIRTAFLAMLFSSVSEIALLYQQVRKRAVFFVVFSLTQLFAGAGLNIYFIALQRRGVLGFVLSKLVVTGLSVTLLVVLVFRETGYRFRWEAGRRMLSFGGPLMLSSASMFIIHFADRFFLSHFTSLGEVGMYALAYKLGFLVTYLVGQPFGSVWNASLYAHVAEQGWNEKFGQVASSLAFFLVLAAGGISVFADGLLTIVADRAFLAAALLVPMIAFGYAFREVGDFFRGLLFINKRVFLFGRITMSCALLNLGLDWVLIGSYGATGAAWATLLTWFAYMTACWTLARREHPLPFSPFRLAVLCGIAGVLYYTSTFFRGLPLFGQFVVDGFLMLLFIAYGWKAGYLQFGADGLAKPDIAAETIAVQALQE
jgi:O-antigen/teichoic acid export membrane protein